MTGDQQREKGPGGRRGRGRLFGWWYVCIGAGFLLLAVHRLMIGERPGLVALRVLIGAAFAFLGYRELRLSRGRD